MSPRVMFAFGHGFSSRALERQLDGWRYFGTTRDGRGDSVKWPGDAIEPLLDQATHLLISAAPNAQGDPVLSVLREYLTQNANRFDWVGYLSTTGVYGDHAGDWVDETTALSPATERGKRRVLAEADWQSIAGLPLHIFRLAGIYGPGRGPFGKILNGTARRLIKPGQIFSRIHVKDIAQALVASIAQPNPGAIYNLCDDDPQPPEIVIEHAARLLNLPVPPAEPFETAEMTPMARSFYSESKRVRNDRIKDELGIRLIYPSYKDGLAADLQFLRKS